MSAPSSHGLEVLRERRGALARRADRFGLDYIEVEAAEAAAGRVARRRRLHVHFVAPAAGVARPPLPPGLRLEALHIADRTGAPASGLRVVSATPAADGRAVLEVEVLVGDDALAAAVEGEVYSLAVQGVPAMDPFFSHRPFALVQTAGLGAPARPAPPRPLTPTDTPEIDYLVKDYSSFRQAMLDQLAVLAPTWTEQGPADMGMAIVEVLAYAADYLSYYQDAVATEAYLGTARQRISVRRHARLLGYVMHEGANARAWAQVTVDGDGPVPLPAGTQLLTRVPGPSETSLVLPSSRIHDELLARGAEVFETLEPATLFAAHNRLSVYTWGAREWSLAAGATRATLVGHLPHLACGDVLIFEVLDADARARHAVRLASQPELTSDPLFDKPITEIAWFAADALPFELPVATSRAGQELAELSVAYGNVVLADHGRTTPPELLPPVPLDRPFGPALSRPHVVFSVPYAAEAARHQPASLGPLQDPRQARPAMRLVELDTDGEATWSPQPDLLRSDRFAQDFVVEVDNRGFARLRFGDDVLGRRPSPGTRLAATYRVEGGPRGDVDADAIAFIVSEDPRLIGVRNPLPAEAGLAPEALDEVRIHAPQQVVRSATCVTEDDYAQAAAQHPQVLHAVARLVWSGSGYVARIHVQRRGGEPLDAAFVDALDAFLRPRLVAGIGLEIRPPHLVPLEIALQVIVDTRHYRGGVGRRLAERFGTAPASAAATTGGYFAPDAFTFGQPVYLSPIVAAAMQVPGVQAVEWLGGQGRFQRWGRPARGELEAGRIDIGPLEVARVANSPGAPSLGSITFDLRGGR